MENLQRSGCDRVTIPIRSYNRHKDYWKRVYASDEGKEEALEKTYKLEFDLGSEYPTIYLARKTKFSGGWKCFACAHELDDRDTLVFKLVKRIALKVYIIIKVNGVAEEG
ncbi:hypothetical protein RIF29_11451 [Crotalaria pallida]|uniref:TF-B3 domain-containing protein n=1 Tax=Crotalaria pallida TaxID=3830 RepID=A0AAN9P046_CROPI